MSVNDAAGILEGGAVDVAVLSNDLDPAGGGLTVIAVGQPDKGTASIKPDNATVHYAAPKGTSGVDSFTYTVRDANGQTDTALIAIVITRIEETDDAPQVTVIDPTVQNTEKFTNTQAAVTVDLPANAVTATLGITDVFFLAYTPVVTPTEQTQHGPGGSQFGNLQFDLTAYWNDVSQHGLQFAHPVTLTIVYDPALMNGLDLATLELFYWNGTEWTRDGIEIISHDIPNATITVTISHLSEFAFFAALSPTALEPGAEPAIYQSLYLPLVGRAK